MQQRVHFMFYLLIILNNFINKMPFNLETALKETLSFYSQDNVSRFSFFLAGVCYQAQPVKFAVDIVIDTRHGTSKKSKRELTQNRVA